VLPEFLEIPYFAPSTVLAGLADQADLVFFDSANHAQPFEQTNRYSYLCYRPIERFVLKNGVLNGSSFKGDPLQSMQTLLQHFPLTTHPKLPPFQGGAAGCFSYDLCHYFESISQNPNDTLRFPDLAIGIYDVVIAFDHQQQKAWIIATGYPQQADDKRLALAHQRIAQTQAELQAARLRPLPDKITSTPMQSNCTSISYEHMVNCAIEYILNGDIFEVNLSQRFQTELSDAKQTLALYLQLRQINPAPFAGYLRFGNFTLASASPERFLQVCNKTVETRPIKGTIAVDTDPLINEQNKQHLRNSEKDRAENIMIVDLMRNDLSRVCEPESVQVQKLCALESYASVHHLVSVVRGQLTQTNDAIDLLRVSFPGGSITGAPKIRAMQLISELESCPRGPHYGSLGFIGFDGNMDSSILIRSFACMGKQATLQAGGAVVLDSEPKQEYNESLLKAAKCQQVLA
jgi:para-aminobenzoate synthetase component 1